MGILSDAVKKVKKAVSSVNDARKDVLSSVNAERKRALKNPDVWKAAAVIAAPYALPAIGAAGASAGGFLTKAAATGGQFLTGLLPGGGATAAGTEAAGGGFFSSIMSGAKNMFAGASDQLKAKMADPKYMSEMMMRAGSALAGSAIAGDGLSDEERKLMNHMMSDMRNLRDQDQALFDEKLAVAREVIQGGRAIDEEYYGLKAQRDVQIAGGAQMRQADREAKMREGGRGLSAADRRRAGLDITRQAQSAYIEGRESGQDKRLKAIATGAGLMPNEAPRGSIAAGLQLATNLRGQEKDRAESAKSAGKLVQDVFGFDKPRSTGGLKLPEDQAATA